MTPILLQTDGSIKIGGQDYDLQFFDWEINPVRNTISLLYRTYPIYHMVDPSGLSVDSTVYSTVQELADVLEDNKASFGGSGGGGGGEFTVSNGTDWDGSNQRIVLSGNTTLNFSTTKRAGQLRIIHNGHSLTLNLDDSSTQAFTLTGGSAHVLLVFEAIGTEYEFEVVKDLITVAIPTTDTTAPLPLSFSIEDASPADLVVVFDESLNDTSIPAPGDFTSLLGKVFTVDITGDTLTLTADTDYENGDVEQITYTPGTNKIKDLAGNLAAAFDSDDFSGVDNNISAPGGYDSDSLLYFSAAGITDSPTKNAWNDVVVGLKGISLTVGGTAWSKGVILAPLAGPDLAAQSVNAKTPGTFDFTLHGSPVYSANGLNYDGVDDYADPSFTPVTHLTSTTDDVTFYIGISTSPTTDAFCMGTVGDGAIYLVPKSAGSNTTYRLYSADRTFSNGTPGGRYLFTWNNSSTLKMYRNAVNVETTSTTPQATHTSFKVYFGAVSVANTPNYFGAGLHTFYAVFDARMTASEAAAVDALFATYLTAMGR